MRMWDKNYLIVGVMIFLVFSVIGKDNPRWVKEEITQVHVGNFALPTSQQPGPLIGFGQNIVDKGDLQLFVFPDQLKGKSKSYVEVIPSILYGINDKFSVFIQLPIAAKFKIEPFKSHGVEDLTIQLEGVVYAKETTVKVNEITLVANMGFPTGSIRKTPATGFGAVSFFLGFTASHTATDWYYFTSSAVTLTTPHKDTKFGNQFLYQFGLSRNISYKADKLIFNWIVELDGLYRQQNRLSGVTDSNSGGNVVLLGPSLWFSTQRLIAQLGISAVISEHLFGSQPRDNYFIAANVGWKF